MNAILNSPAFIFVAIAIDLLVAAVIVGIGKWRSSR